MASDHLLLLSFVFIFFFQAEDGIRDLVRSRGLGDVYKRQVLNTSHENRVRDLVEELTGLPVTCGHELSSRLNSCLLYTSDAADERSSVDLGGRRIIKKKTNIDMVGDDGYNKKQSGVMLMKEAESKRQ